MFFFVDPSYSSERNDKDHWYGIGFWDDEKRTKEHWARFGVQDIVTHYKMTSKEFLMHDQCPKCIDLLYIDGNHSYEGVRHDFTQYYDRLSPNAIILAHDVDPEVMHNFPASGAYEALTKLDPNRFEVFRLPVYPGLAIVRKKCP